MYKEIAISKIFRGARTSIKTVVAFGYNTIWHVTVCSLTRIRIQTLRGKKTENCLKPYVFIWKQHDDCSNPYVFTRKTARVGPNPIFS